MSSSSSQSTTVGKIFHDYLFSFFLSTIIIFWACVNQCVSENIVKPLKEPISNINNKGTTDLYHEKDLSLYDGIQKSEMYLSITGQIFDVSEAKRHYGPDSTYHIFVAKDNSKAFITGQFKVDDISDDILSLPPADVIGIQNWLKFYRKTYKRKGKLIGRYYDESGKLTLYGKEVKKMLKHSEKDLANKAAISNRFPECNVEWKPEKGSTFWCSSQSGGIKRDWEGLPKKLFQPGYEPRCACIQENEINILENIKSYKNCYNDGKICIVPSSEMESLNAGLSSDESVLEGSIHNEL